MKERKLKKTDWIILCVLLVLIGACVIWSQVSQKNEKEIRYIPSLASLNNSGCTIGILSGTASMYAAETYFDKARIEYVTSPSSAYLAVQSDKIDAFVYDKYVLEYAVANNEEIAILPDSDLGDEDIVIGSGFGNEKLIAEVNDFIRLYRADGTYERMYQYWITDRNTIMPDIPIPANPNRKLKVGTMGFFKPMNYMINGEELVGFDIEFALRLGAYLNAEIEFETMSFDALMASTVTGKLDLMITSINVTPDIQDQLLLTNNYVSSTIAVGVHANRVPGNVSVSSGQEDMNRGRPGFWAKLQRSFYRSFIQENRWKLILSGIETTLILTIFSTLFGTILAFLICLFRRVDSLLAEKICRVFVKVFQGTPMVVILMMLYYVIFADVAISPTIVAIFAFSLNFAAYTSEIMRSGIEAVERGQWEAAYALGYTENQTFFRYIFPQAAVHFMPVYKGEIVSILKSTSVVGYIAVKDLTKMNDVIRNRTYEPFFPIIVSALIYFLLAWILTWFVSRIALRIDPRHNRKTRGHDNK